MGVFAVTSETLKAMSRNGGEKNEHASVRGVLIAQGGKFNNLLRRIEDVLGGEQQMPETLVDKMATAMETCLIRRSVTARSAKMLGEKIDVESAERIVRRNRRHLEEVEKLLRQT